jgi:hypothetical protein
MAVFPADLWDDVPFRAAAIDAAYDEAVFVAEMKGGKLAGPPHLDVPRWGEDVTMRWPMVRP